jgi:hypothetical protein
VKQDSAFCPDTAGTPDDKQVWFTPKDIGRTMVFDARPPFTVLKSIDTGPITNHVNIVCNAKGNSAYVTVGRPNAGAAGAGYRAGAEADLYSCACRESGRQRIAAAFSGFHD